MCFVARQPPSFAERPRIFNWKEAHKRQLVSFSVYAAWFDSSAARIAWTIKALRPSPLLRVAGGKRGIRSGGMRRAIGQACFLFMLFVRATVHTIAQIFISWRFSVNSRKVHQVLCKSSVLQRLFVKLRKVQQGLYFVSQFWTKYAAKSL